MKNDICDAIASRKVLHFEYDGGARYVEPYCFGMSRKGKPVIRAYQIGGFSQSSPPVGWRLFDVTKIVGAITAGETFTPDRPEYNPDDKAMTTIYCYV